MTPPSSSSTPPRILIFGTGSIGTLYTYILSRAIPPSHITAICRSNYAAATQHGFTINSTLWGDSLNVRPQICRTVDEAVSLLPPDSIYDYVLVCAKALPTTPSIPDILKPAITESRTAVILIQNGIAIEAPYAIAYPSNPILSGVVYLPATQTAPAVVAHKEVETLHIGTYPAKGVPASHRDSARAFVQLMEKAGATAYLHDDVQGERWAKLLVNAAWNPVCALTRSRDAEFLAPASSNSPSSDGGEVKDEAAIGYIRNLMTEISQVAQACGYEDVNEDKVEWQIGRARARGLPGVEPSMMADAMAGREMEIDAILGNVVKIAEEKGVEVLLLKSLLVLARALNGSFLRWGERGA